MYVHYWHGTLNTTYCLYNKNGVMENAGLDEIDGLDKRRQYRFKGFDSVGVKIRRFPLTRGVTVNMHYQSAVLSSFRDCKAQLVSSHVGSTRDRALDDCPHPRGQSSTTNFCGLGLEKAVLEHIPEQHKQQDPDKMNLAKQLS